MSSGIPRSCSWMLPLFLSTIVVWCLWFSVIFCSIQLRWRYLLPISMWDSHQQGTQLVYLCLRPDSQIVAGCCFVSMAFPQCFWDADSWFQDSWLCLFDINVRGKTAARLDGACSQTGFEPLCSKAQLSSQHHVPSLIQLLTCLWPVRKQFYTLFIMCRLMWNATHCPRFIHIDYDDTTQAVLHS